MFIDLRDYSGPADINTDVCIVGAGAAGITLALELEGPSRDVCVLESGSFEYDVDTQSLADGDNIGLPYYELIASRLRFFGLLFLIQINIFLVTFSELMWLRFHDESLKSTLSGWVSYFVQI